MNTYFKINYEFDKNSVHEAIANRIDRPGADYICVADGVIMNTANRLPNYLEVINGGMFSICDSSFVPLYIKWIHGKRYSQYSGTEILTDIVNSRKYRMYFLGGNKNILDNLKKKITEINPDAAHMKFEELPYCKAEDFDYKGIAEAINKDKPDIIFVSLGAPKQEYFMHYLKPYLRHGVMIAVGAAFHFLSGTDMKRAPKWMVKHHMEFVYRLYKEPRKQFRRCFDIVRTLPGLIIREAKKR